MKATIALFAALALTVSAVGGEAVAKPKPAMAKAGPCKDAKGLFIKCPAPAPVAEKSGPCKDAKGRFIKCAAPVALAPTGGKPTAQCKDHSFYFAKSRAGACSGHGGVTKFL
jgi:hypothetical protein